MTLLIEKHQFLLRGRAERLTRGHNDRRTDGRMDGLTDKETGIGTNEDGKTDPPDGVMHIDYCMNLFIQLKFHYLQGMQLMTSSSTPAMYWLVRQWNSWLCKLKTFRLIWIILDNIFLFDFYSSVLYQIFCLQGMQLTADSSAPLMSWLSWGWYYCILELESFWLIC